MSGKDSLKFNMMVIKKAKKAIICNYFIIITKKMHIQFAK